MRRFTLVTAVLAALLVSGADAQRRFVLEGATLINGVYDRPLRNNVVVVDGGRITGVGKPNKVIIPQGADVIDLTGKYIIPGLIDAHVHEESMDDWPEYLRWGVTSVNCMYENTDTAIEREAWSLSDTLRAPGIHATAPVFTAKGGWWEGEGYPADPDVNRFPDSPAEAREAVRALHAKGIRRIKLMVDDMGWCRDPLPRLRKMEPEVMRAIIDEARKLKVLTEVHAPNAADASAALAAGATALVHGVIDERLDAPFVDALYTGNGYYLPTFSLYHFLASPDSFISAALSDTGFLASLPPEKAAELTSGGYAAGYLAKYPNASYVRSHLGILADNVAALTNNYVQIAMGTDMWALPGIGAHLELQYMVDAGLTPMQAIVSSTFLSAKFLGVLPRTGSLEPGKDADIVVLNADPLADIRNTRAIDMVIKKGRIFRPADFSAARGR
jgi:imidazolonepropionase-like amidohydrolase